MSRAVGLGGGAEDPRPGRVDPKKRLGQHFLRDECAATSIVEAVEGFGGAHVVEIGPGMGVLTKGLSRRFAGRFTCIELDEQAVAYLRATLPGLGESLVHADCLRFDFGAVQAPRLSMVGNLPYNISSQVLWRVLSLRDRVQECVFMLQHEVAERVASEPGGREYGILSVLVQAYYDASLLLTLPPAAFSPPPKVRSSVLRLRRNGVKELGCDETLLVRVVKSAFNQRRKTLRNSLRAAFPDAGDGLPFEKLRPEELGVAEFVALTNAIADRVRR